MPIISRFYGITVQMYFQRAEHNPPHVHVIYSDKVAAIEIRTGKVLDGKLPPKALSQVREWIMINKDALLAMWETQEFRTLEPLN